MDALNNDRDDQFLNLMKAIRARPVMYFGVKSSVPLGNFLGGYCFGMKHCGEKDYFSAHRPHFDDWILMKEGAKKRAAIGAWNALNSNSSSEEEAFDKFFMYLDDYLVRSPVVIHEEALPELAQKYYKKIESRNSNPVPIRVEIVSYDKNLDGVFLRYFDANGVQVDFESYSWNLAEARHSINVLNREI